MNFWNDAGDWDLDSTCAVVGIHEEDYYNHHNKTPCIINQIQEKSCVVEPWWRRGTTYEQPEPPLDDDNDDHREGDVTIDKKGMMMSGPREVDYAVLICGSMDCLNLCWNVNAGTTIAVSPIDTATKSPLETDSSEEIRDSVDMEEGEVESPRPDPTIQSIDEQVDLTNETTTLVSPTKSLDDVRHHDDTHELDRALSLSGDSGSAPPVELTAIASNISVDSNHVTKRENHEAEEERPVELLEQPACSLEEQYADSFPTSKSSDNFLGASTTRRSSTFNVMMNPYEDENQEELGKGETCRCHAPTCKVM